jgi:L-Ala-D/L-Glu epimerase
MLQLYAEVLYPRLRASFDVRGAAELRFETVLVAISDLSTGRVGFGECAIDAHYTRSAREVWAELQQDGEPLACDADVQTLLDRCRWLTPVARSGVVGALLDLAGQAAQQPVWQRWSTTPNCPPSSVTVTARTPTGLAGELVGLQPLRPGSITVRLSPFISHQDNRQRLAMVREQFPDCQLGADLDASWRYEQVLEAVEYLDRVGVNRLIEPLSLDAPLTDYAALARNTPFTLVADERLLQHSFDELAQCFHEVTLKRLYHGGILGVAAKLAQARARGLRICLACNLETGVGTTAIVQLGPLADHLDLDPALRLLDAPVTGIGWSGCQPILGAEPGFGIRAVATRLLSDHLGQLLANRSTV